jgi:hypothetical protein
MQAVEDCGTEKLIDLTVTFFQDKLKLVKAKGFVKYMMLESKISTKNMVAYDIDGNLQRFTNEN